MELNQTVATIRFSFRSLQQVAIGKNRTTVSRMRSFRVIFNRNLWDRLVMVTTCFSLRLTPTMPLLQLVGPCVRRRWTALLRSSVEWRARGARNAPSGSTTSSYQSPLLSLDRPFLGRSIFSRTLDRCGICFGFRTWWFNPIKADFKSHRQFMRLLPIDGYRAVKAAAAFPRCAGENCGREIVAPPFVADDVV